MFQALKRIGQTLAGSGEPRAAPEPDDPERRLYERHNFSGGEIDLIAESTRYRLRLKDISCRGACGLTDAPLTQGEIIVVEIDDKVLPSAEVRWTRNAMVGMRFVNTLDYDYLRGLHERHESGEIWSPAMRAEPGARGWWVDEDKPSAA